MDNNELLQAIRGIVKEEVIDVVRTIKEEFNPRFEKIDERFERIDERFERIDERFEKIDERFERIDERFEKIDERFERIDERFENLENSMLLFNHRLDKIELTIENDINKNIRVLHEGFKGINQKLDKLDKLDNIEEDVEDLKMRVEVIEEHIKENTYVN